MTARRALLAPFLALLLLAGGAPAARADAIPATYYVHPLPARFSQNPLPACVVYAGGLARMVLDRQAGPGPWPTYDLAGAWADLVRAGAASDAGTTLGAFLRYEQTVGLRVIDPRDVWRYSYLDHGVWRLAPLPVHAAGRRVRIRGFYAVDPHDPAAIQRAILANGPLELSLVWDWSWNLTPRSGLVPPPSGQSPGLHALVVYGWTTRAGALSWYVADSDPLWGDRGLGVMPDADRSAWSELYAIR